MLWFYTRNRDSLRIETRYDNLTQEYVGIVTHPGGGHEAKRFRTVDEFRAWLVGLERELATQQWIPDGAPQVLADGWPDTRPLQ